MIRPWITGSVRRFNREIVERKEDDPQTFRTYRAAMEKFASDQLEMGRFTDDLAVLYRTFLRKHAHAADG